MLSKRLRAPPTGSNQAAKPLDGVVILGVAPPRRRALDGSAHRSDIEGRSKLDRRDGYAFYATLGKPRALFKPLTLSPGELSIDEHEFGADRLHRHLFSTRAADPALCTRYSS